MTDGQEALVLDNLGLARHISIRYSNTLGHEEAYAEAYFGLVKAALLYTPDKGSFSTYAGIRINGELNDEVRRRTPGSRYGRERGETYYIGSLDVMVDEIGADKLPFADKEPLPDEQVEIDHIKRRVYEAMQTLEGRDAFVANARLVEEMPLIAIGNLIGVSESRVSQITKRALKNLRKALPDFDKNEAWL